MIRSENLRKRFDDVLAVDGISLDVATGEVFGLLGPNGAGKTTTINMLVGILKPDGGSIAIDGESDPTRPRVRRKIGNAPQAIALYDELTAEENLAFFGSLYDLHGSHLKERIDWTLDLAGLTERRTSQVKTFSGGMKRRLNLACALIHDPPLLLLDEPTVGVDPQSRNLIFEKVENLRSSGRTIIYTTHYMEEAQRLCDRVAIVDHGKVLALDTVDNLIDQHGGRTVVQIEFDSPPESVSDLPGEMVNGRLHFESDTPFDDAQAIRDKEIKFRAVHIERPDLESVFLNLTGRRLRD